MKTQESKFFQIRNFIIFAQKESMEKACKNNEQWKPSQWFLDRINFSASVSCNFNQHTFEELIDKTFFLYANNPENATEQITGLRAVAMTEGEFKGEVFFFTSGVELSKDEWNRLFDFAETECKATNIHFDNRFSLAVQIAKERGFSLDTGWSEKQSVLKFSSLTKDGVLVSKSEKCMFHSLKDGFKLIDNTENKITPQMKINIHYYAFQIYAKEKQPLSSEAEQIMIKGWSSLLNVPDYNPYLDLMILDKNNTPAAMMGFWFDSVNKIAVIEPAGTHPNYQRQGLGRFLIEEGCLRLKKLGVKELWVCNEMDFYTSCGFKVVHQINIWNKN